MIIGIRPRARALAPGVKGLIPGFLEQMGDIVAGKRQGKRGRIFLAFQMGLLNYWVRVFQSIKTGQLVTTNYLPGEEYSICLDR